MRRCVFGHSLFCFPCTRDLICGIFWELYLYFFGSEGYLFGSVEELTHTGRLHLAFVLFGEMLFSQGRATSFKAHRSLAGVSCFGGKCLSKRAMNFCVPAGKMIHTVRLLFTTLFACTHFLLQTFLFFF